MGDTSSSDADNVASCSIHTAGNEEPSDKSLEKLVTEAVAKTVPQILANLMASAKANVETVPNTAQEQFIPAQQEAAEALPSRGDRFYQKEGSVSLSEDLLELTTKAFSQALPKDKWKNMIESYPPIKGMENMLVAPTMEAGMKEDVKKHHGYSKTKETFSFDDGLAERQGPFLCVARPILAALDMAGGEEEEEAPDPDSIKAMLEDALVFLGNAAF